jgi:diguanylate cyclase (GGDEF)-like protein/PAS domain S-box-containing protein
LDANESHEKIMRLKNKDILGKNISNIFPSIEKSVIEKLGHVVKTGEPICYENYLQEIDKHYEVIAYRPKKLQLAVICITQRKQAEEALKASEYNFRNIFEGSLDGIFLNQGDKIIDCNQAMVELLGYDSKACVLSKSIDKFSPERQPNGELSKEKALEMSKRTIKNRKCKFEWWYKRVDGRLLPVEVMMTTIVYSGKKVFHSIWRDISERKQMEDTLEYLSYHDQLTGLYNRRFFEEELSRLDVESNFPLTLVMGDVNGLKLVNDSFGHATGDELLKKVAEVMIKGCRTEDIVARLGGDEFVILLPKTDSYEAEQIVKYIKDLSSKEKVGSVDISISFGYETKNDKEEKIHDILKKAEDHMYKKKLFESPSMRGKTINAIITTLHEKNKREEQHSYRVSKLCESMGIAIELSEDEIKELKNVGLLHDIGKIAIEENILNKQGKLTDEEWEEIKRHPEIGYRILRTVNDMSEMAEYVLYHHEKWNGTGYPKGLKGEEIPLQSRIIAIADAYDAMISERSYRSALPEEVAVEELKINAGIQFDLELIKVFLEKVLNKPFDENEKRNILI